MTEIANYIQIQGQRIHEKLNQLIPNRPGPHQHLYEAARYSLLAGGKRIRPLLTLAMVDTFGGDQKIALSPACTLELIHTYSLIHDDLPCMDDDDFRRGQPSLHKQYPEGHAVLTGDYLLTYAFEVLATDPLLTAEKKVDLISVLAQRSGSEGMIGGQVMDISLEGKPITVETLRQLHLNKTGALISAAVEFGGILANASMDQMKTIRRFGENIGLTFQIIDDILDVTSSQEKHGRSIASDVINEKTTYVTLLGLAKAQAVAEQHYRDAIDAIMSLNLNADLLIGLAGLIMKRHN